MVGSLQEIKNYMATISTYFQIQDEEDYISISSRDSSSDCETPDDSDIAEGKRLGLLLIKQFPDNRIDFDVIDEWVELAAYAEPKRWYCREFTKILKSIGIIKMVTDAGYTDSYITGTGGTHEYAYLRFFDGRSEYVIGMRQTEAGVVVYGNAEPDLVVDPRNQDSVKAAVMQKLLQM